MKFAWNYHKVLAIGPSACGKTSLIIETYLKTADKLMILDTNCEISLLTKLPFTRNLKDWSPQIPCYYPKQYDTNHLDECIKRVRCFNNVLFFLDDLDAYTKDLYYSGKELNTIMVNGRHQNIGVIVANKKISNIPKLVGQQAHFIHLWNVNPRDMQTLQSWNYELNYPDEKLMDFTKLDTHTFGLFIPIQEGINATTPKKFVGFMEL